MKAILALGNPGPRYRDTRHNVGWWLADRLVNRWRAEPFREAGLALRTGARLDDGATVEILKPLTYVNRSGALVEQLLDRPGWDVRRDLLVLVDDVWLEPGAIRLRARGSAGGHRGLASLEEAAGSEEYCRMRIGVGRPGDARIELADWVLSPLPHHEEERVLEALAVAAPAVECWIREGIEAAMSRYNRS
ncbi:MAG: aminoacyl-tRNA hydrolase [Gemmatimonadota bacterium]